VHVSLDGRSKARVREFDFDLAGVALGSRSAKGLKVTKWPIKEVKRIDPA
jgi:topoisomerase-4 subunit A